MSEASPSPGRARVVNIRRATHDVYIGRGRGSIWGNPFIIGEHGNRAEVIAKFREWLPNQAALMVQVHSLHGKTLGCFCAPAACHGDVLAEFAELAFNRINNIQAPAAKTPSVALQDQMTLDL